MVASLVRFDCFEITIGIRTGDEEHVVTGTPSAVLHCLELTDDSAAVAWFRSTLAPSRTPCAEVRPPGWWG